MARARGRPGRCGTAAVVRERGAPQAWSGRLWPNARMRGLPVGRLCSGVATAASPFRQARMRPCGRVLRRFNLLVTPSQPTRTQHGFPSRFA